MKNWQADTELRRLVDEMLDGTLSRIDCIKLEERMEADDRAMDYYLALAGQEALLSEATLSKKVKPLESVVTPFPKKRRFHGLAAAAALVAAIGLGFLVSKVNTSTQDLSRNPVPVDAIVTDQVGVVWKKEALKSGSHLSKGSIVSFEAGLAELTHDSGTRLLIEGPASYQVTGPNAGKLSYGKLVAEVPPGAEGFIVEYTDGKVVDLGTEFALYAPEGPGQAEVGVFRGEVRVQNSEETFEQAVPLYTGHAIRTANPSQKGLRSIPFNQERFVRQIPSHEFPWFYKGDRQNLEWDVSHLVWSSGEFQCIIKWMDGDEPMTLSKVELLLNGKVVSSDEHESSIGDLLSSYDNVYHFKVDAGEWKRGTWTLRAWPQQINTEHHSEGILMFEENTSKNDSTDDFVGTWEYVHDGHRYLRKFLTDGTCSLWINGKLSDYFHNAHWTLDDGILQIHFPESPLSEKHILRDQDNLLFINQPYRNARKLK